MPTSPVDCHFKTFIAKSDISCLHKTKLAVASSDKRNPRECEDCYSPLTASCRLATVNLQLWCCFYSSPVTSSMTAKVSNL
ncbi:hypothetical protein DLM40_23085 [Salmonella enterica subsp. enterica serovar Cubana]|nr:hypothetical protein [Salmonella enterica subsp. enterica serovar Cubana]EED2740046.1 hypothetical protein [Salmonella enterica subsp. enterica serovar Havana]